MKVENEINQEYSKVLEEILNSKVEVNRINDPRSMETISKLQDTREKQATNTIEISKVDNLISKISYKPEKVEEEDNNSYLGISDISEEEIKTIEIEYKVEIANKIKQENQINLKKSLNNIKLEKCLECPSVGELSLVERMVEESYENNSKYKYDIAEQICYMKYISKNWRKILGDGNCYYRSIMFRHLELIIFEGLTYELKNIVNKISMWFNSNYKKTKLMPEIIRKSYVEIDKPLIMNIFHCIITLLEENKKLEAYIVLIKCFLYSKVFDITMVLYLRYEIYEFLLSNSDKCYNKEFPIKLGNLLPSQYETEEGNFKFDDFYYKELLKLYTYAEKIVIYISPFVLRRNIRLVIFDYGKECNIQTKDFNCNVKQAASLPSLEVLYRKCHYDVIYNEGFNKKYDSFLSIYKRRNENLKVVDYKLIEYYMNNDVEDVNIEQSKIFDKKMKLEKKNKLQENKEEEGNKEVVVKQEVVKKEEEVKNNATISSKYSSKKEELEKEIENLKLKLNTVKVNTNTCQVCMRKQTENLKLDKLCLNCYIDLFGAQKVLLYLAEEVQLQC